MILDKIKKHAPAMLARAKVEVSKFKNSLSYWIGYSTRLVVSAVTKKTEIFEPGLVAHAHSNYPGMLVRSAKKHRVAMSHLDLKRGDRIIGLANNHWGRTRVACGIIKEALPHHIHIHWEPAYGDYITDYPNRYRRPGDESVTVGWHDYSLSYSQIKKHKHVYHDSDSALSKDLEYTADYEAVSPNGDKISFRKTSQQLEWINKLLWRFKIYRRFEETTMRGDTREYVYSYIK